MYKQMVYISLGYVQSMSDEVGLSWENWRDGPGNTETNCAFLYTTSGQLTIKEQLYLAPRTTESSTDPEYTVQTTEIYTGLYRPRMYCLDYRDLYRDLQTQNILFRLQRSIQGSKDLECTVQTTDLYRDYFGLEEIQDSTGMKGTTTN